MDSAVLPQEPVIQKHTCPDECARLLGAIFQKSSQLEATHLPPNRGLLSGTAPSGILCSRDTRNELNPQWGEAAPSRAVAKSLGSRLPLSAAPRSAPY